MVQAVLITQNIGWAIAPLPVSRAQLTSLAGFPSRQTQQSMWYVSKEKIGTVTDQTELEFV